ncbi:MAG: alpha-ketoacid dehydrogenase subunit beta, partial [Alphaproteobacteria bacterium]|nr:alpha-ketoacid dehydrogenase subunit beta [Alphaproteobacteria bacterium]
EPIPFGKARTMHDGDDLTIVTWSALTPKVAEAARMLAAEGIRPHVLDLRTIWPWDEDAVANSVKRTGRLLVAHEAVEIGGFGGEIVARMIERLGPANIKSVKRIGAPRIPIPFSPPLEDELRVTSQKIVAAAKGIMVDAEV